mgnify:FL=1
MKACRVEIVTFAGGNRSRFTSVGSFCEREDGFTAVYSDEGDEVLLGLSGNALTMDRQGGNAIRAHFSEGETGELSIGCPDGSGGVPMITEVCAARRMRDGWRIALRYRLMFAEVQIYRLTIAVNIISEEQ